jgi:hypothetical protein
LDLSLVSILLLVAVVVVRLLVAVPAEQKLMRFPSLPVLLTQLRLVLGVLVERWVAGLRLTVRHQLLVRYRLLVVAAVAAILEVISQITGATVALVVVVVTPLAQVLLVRVLLAEVLVPAILVVGAEILL